MTDVCDTCGKMAIEWIQNPDGKSPNWIICVDCGKTAGVYCQEHEVPHQGFDDGTTACLLCINVTMRLNFEDRNEIARSIEISLPPEEFEELKIAAEKAGNVSYCDWQMELLRLAVYKSHRRRESLAATIGNLIEEGTAAFLLS